MIIFHEIPVMLNMTRRKVWRSSGDWDLNKAFLGTKDSNLLGFDTFKLYIDGSIMNLLLFRFTGYASRFHFYPEDFVFPLQQSKEYFGELKKQVKYQMFTVNCDHENVL